MDLRITLRVFRDQALGVAATLRTSSPWVTPLQPDQDFGDGLVGALLSSDFALEISPDAQCGSADFVLDIRANGGAYADSIPFTLPPHQDRLREAFSIHDEDMLPSAWTHQAFTSSLDEWRYVTGGCAMPDAASFWRVGPQADCTSSYDDGEGGLLMGVLDTAVDDPELVSLRIKHRYELADGNDACNVWFDHDRNSSLNRIHQFKGSSAGWVEDEIPLAGLFDPPVARDPMLGLELRSDGAGTSTGWFVSEIWFNWEKESLVCQSEPCRQSCFAQAAAGPDTAVCAGQEVLLDGGNASVTGCPSARMLGTVPAASPPRYDDANAVINWIQACYYKVRSWNQCGEEQD